MGDLTLNNTRVNKNLSGVIPMFACNIRNYTGKSELTRVLKWSRPMNQPLTVIDALIIVYETSKQILKTRLT